MLHTQSSACVAELHYSSLKACHANIKVKEYNVRNDTIRYQILKSTNIISCSFALALTVFEILTFEKFDLEKVGQGQWVTGNVAARLQMSKSIKVILYICYFRSYLTCAKNCHKHTHKQRYLTWPWLIGKSRYLPKKVTFDTGRNRF